MQGDRDMRELNAQQCEAVEHTEGPLLVVSGPGSGKTKAIVHRIAHIVRTGKAHPSEILAVTFTNKAAGEMRERARALLAGVECLPTVMTFHAFCHRLLRTSGRPLADIRAGFTPSFSLYDDQDQKQVIRDCCRRLGYDKNNFGESSEKVRDWISKQKNERRTYKNIPNPHALKRIQIRVAIFEAYEAAMLGDNALDFEDLLGEPVRLLHGDDATRKEWNQKFKYIMVDEFQDTNANQYELIRLLTQGHANICVVGDDDQAIYGWRGANVQNLHSFRTAYREVKEIYLEQNYRSTKNIVNASRAVIERNQSHLHKELWTESPAGRKIEKYVASSGADEAQFIAAYAQWWLHRHPDARVAILYRIGAQLRLIEEAIRHSGLKYQIIRGVSFFQRKEIKDVLAYLRVATNHGDNASLLRIINRPSRRIQTKKIIDFADRYGLAKWEAMERLSPRFESMRGFLDLIATIETAASSSLEGALRFIVDHTGYKSVLQQDDHDEEEEEEEDSEGGESRLENVQELIQMAAEASERGETVEEFIAYMALRDVEAKDEGAPVILMTLHSAKGLEFPLVFIPGLEDGLVPLERAMDEGGEEEERRLFYVGMTRAKERLVLTLAGFRQRRGGFTDTPRPSRFFREIPNELIEDLNQKGNTA